MMTAPLVSSSATIQLDNTVMELAAIFIWGRRMGGDVPSVALGHIIVETP